MSTTTLKPLNRRTVVARLLKNRSSALVVTSLGNPTFDVAAAGDSPHNFYLWGAMGGAVMVGMGMALAQPERRVVVFTGDGEMMMGIGSLATVAVEKPENLAIVVLNNEHYAETGMQPAHAGRGVDLTGIARACGFAEAYDIASEDGVETLAARLFEKKGLVFAAIRISIDPTPAALPPRDGPYLRSRFREAILGPASLK